MLAMKILSSVGALILALRILTLNAQEVGLPQTDVQPKPPLSVPSPTSPAPAPELIPPDVLPLSSPRPLVTPAVTSIPQLDESFKNPPIVATENARRHLQWRRLRNLTANDVAVKAALSAAEAASTDREKRQLLRRYYEIQFGKMTALAPTQEMKTFLMEKKRDQLNALPQPRVRPEPTPRVDPTP